MVNKTHRFSFDINLLKRVEAAAKVIEGLATTNGNNLAISRALEIDVADLLKQIQSAKLKTIKGSIDERDALRRSLGNSLCDYLLKYISVLSWQLVSFISRDRMSVRLKIDNFRFTEIDFRFFYFIFRTSAGPVLL